MLKIFNAEDTLLRSQAYVPIYYLASSCNSIKENRGKITRQKLLDFRDEIKRNKDLAANDMENVNYDFIEFDRMSVQGTNDASSIRERLKILEDFIWKPNAFSDKKESLHQRKRKLCL